MRFRTTSSHEARRQSAKLDQAHFRGTTPVRRGSEPPKL
jgi:hypothetical protein